MNLRTFIERPILSAVISISIVVVGIIGLFTLPVEQYPDIAPPSEYDLFRGECGNLAEECCRPVGRGDKRRRGYDIYDFVGL